MVSQNVEQLMRYVSELCACASHGGRVLKVDDRTCVVADVASWSDEMTGCVKARFPSTSVSVHHTPQSLTGFNIKFTLYPVSGAHVNGMTIFVLILCAVGYAWFTAGHHLLKDLQ